MMKKLGLLLTLCFIPVAVHAQSIAPSMYFERVIFDETSKQLEEAIMDTGKRQALYAYNIANASTPRFQPILLEDDREEPG